MQKMQLLAIWLGGVKCLLSNLSIMDRCIFIRKPCTHTSESYIFDVNTLYEMIGPKTIQVLAACDFSSHQNHAIESQVHKFGAIKIF